MGPFFPAPFLIPAQNPCGSPIPTTPKPDPGILHPPGKQNQGMKSLLGAGIWDFWDFPDAGIPEHQGEGNAGIFGNSRAPRAGFDPEFPPRSSEPRETKHHNRGREKKEKSQIQVTFSFLPSSLPSGRASNSLWNSLWNSGGELGKLRKVLRELWELRENFGNFIPAMARGHPRGFRDFSSSGGRRRLRAFPGIWELLAWTGSGGNGMGAFGVESSGS